MTGRQTLSGLQIDPILAEFIETQALPGTDVSPQQFWAGLARMVNELGP